jgi:hypothetical protein
MSRGFPSTFTLFLIFSACTVALVSRGAAAGAQQAGDPVEERLKARNAELDSLLNRESLVRDTTGLDNLPLWDTNADSLFNQYPDFDETTRLRFSLTPLSFSTYNRVEGQRLGVGLRLADQRWFEADAGAGYAFKSHRWSGFGRLTLGEPGGPAVRVEAEDRTIPFGPNRIEYAAGFLSLVAGQDRQDYLRSRGGSLTLFPFRQPDWKVWMTVLHREELPEEARADYYIFGGGAPMEEPNPAIDAGRTRAAVLGGNVSLRQKLIDLEGEAGVAGGELGGDFDYSWQSARATLRPTFPDGGILSVSLEGSRTGGSPPVQSLPYLGGDGNLRAYDRLEFVGRSRASTRIEYATGVDLLGRTGVDVLKKLRLQFIPFFDSGSTWGDVAGVDKSRGNLEGEWKSSVGLGFRREFWLPGVQAVRLDVSRRLDGADDPWSVWFRILPLE